MQQSVCLFYSYGIYLISRWWVSLQTQWQLLPKTYIDELESDACFGCPSIAQLEAFLSFLWVRAFFHHSLLILLAFSFMIHFIY